MLAPVQPAWFGAPLQDRRPALLAAAQRVSSAKSRPTIRLFLPDGPGSNILLNRLASDWGAVGFDVERVRTAGEADLRLIDEVAPSSSAAWYLRRFHCGSAVLCDSEVDKLSDAGGKIDDDQLFIPLAAPVRWSLVGERIQGFAGNRYARHTLTDLQQKPSREGG
jgi:peptide/nickel transport system substrate-binding protein